MEDLTERVLAKVREHERDLLEFGYELVPYKCAQCGVEDHAVDETVEVYRRNGHRLRCLPCMAPDRWRWRVEDDVRVLIAKRPPATRRRLTPVETAEVALERLTCEITDRRLRRARLYEIQASIDVELVQIQERLDVLPGLIADAQKALRALATDPHRRTKEQLVDVVRELERLRQELDG